MDVVSLCSDLIKCKSVTPNDDGAIDVVAEYLSSLGFYTKILIFKSSDGKNEIKNLFARLGTSNNKILGFLGHSDVVPAGDDWEVDPFAAVQKDGYLIGRGVADMKGGVAAFCCAVSKFIKQKFDGSIVILITGDEEVGSYEGAQSLIKWCKENGHIPHDCLIGEPSSDRDIGDWVSTGHRGSINITVKSVGKQGHVANPDNYVNSLSNLCKYIAMILDYKWKYEDKRFPPTNLEPTMLFTNNYAVNVVPDTSSANLNIRFSADYSSEDLKKICLNEAKNYNVSLDFRVSGESYCCDDENLKGILSAAIKDITGINTQFSCGGGTSDGRFLIKHCNVIEFGLRGETIHQKNEKVKIDDLLILEKIYLSFIEKYFNDTGRYS